MGPEMTHQVSIPIWLVSLSGIFTIGLLGIISWFAKSLVQNITDALKDLAKAFETFKDDAPKRFVTQSFFELARQEIKAGISESHRRIDEVSERFESELKTHKEDCPARSK